jgi:uncharacterized protein (UPF0332 family)
LQQSAEFLEDARLLLREDRLKSAADADRAYYCMYWAAQAALTQRGIATKTHRGLINRFGNEFMKTDIVSHDLFRYLQEAFDAHQESTYVNRKPAAGVQHGAAPQPGLPSASP